MARKKIVANWKMNGSLDLLKAYCSVSDSYKENFDLIICPSAPYLGFFEKKSSSHVFLGGQNCSSLAWDDGAFTGEVSAKHLKECGARYVIIGHSERRHFFHESPELIKEKIAHSLKAGLVPILCVGESLETRAFLFNDPERLLALLKEQVKTSLPDVPCSLFLAYEPLWAIGTGKIPSCEEVEVIHAFLKKEFGHPILYGGSVNAKNASSFLSMPHVEGLLIGGSSLDIEEMKKILKA